MKTLFPHQIENIQFLKDKSRYLLADEQGLGKSCTALNVIRNSTATNILILCPKSLILNWVKEIKTWDTFWFSLITPSMSEITQDIPNSSCFRTYYIFNWDSLINKKRMDILLKQSFDYVVGDESHVGIKSWTAKRCKAFVFDIVPRARKILLMTGTPITRSASDLHPTLSVLLPGKVGKFGAFCEKFCVKNYHGFGYKGFDYKGFKNEAELHALLKTCMVRHTKKEVLPNLPDKMYKEVEIEIDKDIVKECLRISPDIIKSCIDNEAPLPGHIMNVMQAVGLSKVGQACEYISNIGKGCVVFAHHRSVIKALKDCLEEQGFSVGIIQGDTSTDERQRVVDEFQSENLDIVIGNLVAASSGITLTRSTNVVFVEFPWSPSTLEQAEDRCHRIGTKNAVLIHNLVACGSLDSIILESLHEKKIGIRKIV